jgi:hypothetical protein
MKVIDLLNKIANNEITELHKFKWNEGIWEEYSKFEEINNDKSYQEHRENGTSFMRFENICDTRHFNDEIEIIEEKPKKIEKIELDSEENIIYYEDGEKHRFNTNKQNKYFAHKIIELQKAVNYLLEKESDK